MSIIDDFDADDFAFVAGFVETQLEGEKAELEPEEPLTFEEIVSTRDEMVDDEDIF